MSYIDDLMDVHEQQTITDHNILRIFWNKENDDMTIGEIKSTIRKTYERQGILIILEDCEKRYTK